MVVTVTNNISKTISYTPCLQRSKLSLAFPGAAMLRHGIQGGESRKIVRVAGRARAGQVKSEEENEKLITSKLEGLVLGCIEADVCK